MSMDKGSKAISRKTKSEKQRATMEPARDCAGFWTSKMLAMHEALIGLPAWKSVEFREIYEPQIKEASRRGYKSKKQCMIRFLIYCAGRDIIFPFPFRELTDPITLCGWS